MPTTIRPRPYPLIAIVVALALSGVVVASAVLGAGFRPESPEGAVAALTGRPSLPTPSPTARPTPTPTAVPTSTPTLAPRQPIPELVPLPTPTPDPVLAMNLFRKGDFVSQATKDQCVSAAMQIMLNIMGPKDDRSTRTQARLDSLAEELTATRKGATEPKGWAAGLEQLGAGGYRIEVAPSRTKAILRGVTAMRATGRPVGLLVWRGAHSWVLHGYEATADPLAGVPFEVTHLFVTDPWYPRISSIWGASRGPNARITPKQLEEDYLPWRRPSGRYPGMDGQYILVLPEN